ncbi:MAG: KpsF/GutQ family sugar-phosphate isomerase [Candidatus Marinimicrobia bacterium]|nr:KpsF/GutQ family sugar-phosphate isomerase [Candidatus Neomarinimicrobiota bacterium]
MKNNYLEKAIEVLEKESEAIKNAIPRIDDNFTKAVEIISNSSGKVVVSGLGKSGIIGRKIAATLSSTGTPSLFMHAGEASHGDIGVLTKNDVMIIVSNSGETEELLDLIPYVKKIGVPIIGFIGKENSILTKKCNVVISTYVKEEACPHGIVPTVSSIVTNALGDALAIALMVKRGLNKKELGELHPGGSIGKRLLTTVSDLMHTGEEIPLISTEKTMKEALFVMTFKGLGIVGVYDEHDELVGVITDGDLRRGLERTNDFLNCKTKEIMTTNPKWTTSSALALEALQVMETHAITNLFVYEKEKKGLPIGIIHIHDILRYGISI